MTIAKEVMEKEVLSAADNLSLEEALKLLVNNQITGLPVVDAKGKMVGVLSEYDIISQLAERVDLDPSVFDEPIQFTKEVTSVKESTALEEILKLFVDKKIRRLPVTSDEGKLVGIITRRDIMRLYYYRAKFARE